MKTCDDCDSPERDHSDDGYCSICKLRGYERQYPPEFRHWVANLTRLFLWGKAGYPLSEEGLGFTDWQALSEIARFYEVRDLEAVASAGLAGR